MKRSAFLEPPQKNVAAWFRSATKALTFATSHSHARCASALGAGNAVDQVVFDTHVSSVHWIPLQPRYDILWDAVKTVDVSAFQRRARILQ
jgi:hypothetical protein